MSHLWQALTPALLGVAGLAALVVVRPRLRGTTLIAPWLWALASLVVLVAAEVCIALATTDRTPDWAAAIRFAAAMTTFCPAMAVFGAKRPQDRAWQWIVLSLWVILSLPSAEWLLFGSGEALTIHPARSWFLLILMLAGSANSWPTRFAVSSLLFLAGQSLALVEYLPGGAQLAGLMGLSSRSGLSTYFVYGLALMVAASWLVALDWPGRSRAGTPVDRMWRDFRDLFGAVWGLRVAERVNATAKANAWPVVLGWQGFHLADGTPATDADDLSGGYETLRTLLRRFVSADWIVERMERADEPAGLATHPPKLSNTGAGAQSL